MLTGKRYIGKKFFWSKRRKIVRGRKNRKLIVQESNWKTYKSSSKTVQADIALHGSHCFNYAIINCYVTRSEVNYAELELQVQNKVLSQLNAQGEYEYYNENIARKFFRKKRAST